MLPLERRRLIDWWLGKFQIAAAIAITFFGAMLKAEPSHFGSLEAAVVWIQNWAWAVVVAGPFLVAVLQWARNRFGNPWAWEAIQKILDEFSNEVFKDSRDPDDYHRVTLFKHHKWCWSWNLKKLSNWLVAEARSGHLTKEKITRFRVPDDGEACQGVAGFAWRHRDWVRVPENDKPLPVLTSAALSAEISEYATLCKVDPGWIRGQLSKGRPLAKSYAALRVQLKGKPWGVLVLDSRNPGPIDKEKLDRFKAYGNLLTPLLERI